MKISEALTDTMISGHARPQRVQETLILSLTMYHLGWFMWQAHPGSALYVG